MKTKQIPALFLAVLLILSLSACSSNGGSNPTADLKAVMSDMKGVLTNKEMMDLGEDSLMTNYGVEKDWVKQFAIYIDTTGTKGDEIILLEGKDKESAQKIKTQIDLRYSQKESEMKGYLPEEYALLQKCKVNVTGNYVSLIVSPQYEALQKIYNEALK